MLEYALKMQKNVQLLFTKVAQTIDELDAVDALHNYGSVDFNAIANLMYEIDAVKTYFDEQEFVITSYSIHYTKLYDRVNELVPHPRRGS